MNHRLFSSPYKRGLQVVLLLAMLLLSLGPAGTQIVLAAPPVNDTLASATVINSLIFDPPAFSTAEATPPNPGPSEPADPDIIDCDGTGTDPLDAGYATVWYTYTPATSESIAVDTHGSSYDTFVAVWTVTSGNLNLVACNDDPAIGYTSELFFTGAAGTPYYIEVAQFTYYENNPGDPPTEIGGTLNFNAYISNVNVVIGTDTVGKYYLPPQGSLRKSYVKNNGPVQIFNTAGTPIIAALRAIWQENLGIRSSYSEMMGLPTEQLSTEYWFPWYNNTDTISMDQGFRIGNVDSSQHTIQVWVGTTKLSNPDIVLAGGASTRVDYPVNNGPIRIVCTDCTNPDDKIVAAIRVIWQEPGYRSSYSEMMGLPKEDLSTEYWFPWYNNTDTISMNQGFRIGNVDSSQHTIQVWVGTTKVSNPDIVLAGGASTRVDYPVNNGPIRIVCTDCTNPDDKIIAAMRVIWQENLGIRSSYSEMMGLPIEQLSTEYWFPWYNNLSVASMDQGFRIGNVDSSQHTIQVWVGTTKVSNPDIVLAGGASTRVGYPVDNGPIRIVCTDCTGGQKIIAALRVIWQEPGYRSSYSEMMGLPVEQLSTKYWFPWYNNAVPASMDQGLRFGFP